MIFYTTLPNYTIKVKFGFSIEAYSVKTLKISICGDTGVGKTAIRKRWCENYFDTDCRMSLGVDIGIGKVLIDKTAIKLQVWDVSGQTRFKEVRKGYYEGCWGGVLVFDIIHPASSFHMGSWIQELWQNSGLGQIPIVIVGNKQDLLYNHAQRISRQYGIALSQYISKITIGKGFKCEYIEVSAKTGHSIDQAFKLLTLNIIRYITHLNNN